MKRLFSALLIFVVSSILYAQVADSTGAHRVDSALVIGANAKKSVVVKEVDNDTYPSPKKAALYSALFPGLGQIYNKKYWKLPIVYGGIGACIYAFSWNNRMYHDYFDAYRDLTVMNPDGTHSGDSYLAFIPGGGDLSTVDEAWFESALKQKKDYYKQYRDLSILILAGVYVIQILDANVDAHFYSFDISRDLSLKLDPVMIDDPLKYGVFGFKMSIDF